jgi:Ca2+-binding EF-hand superfamily protein
VKLQVRVSFPHCSKPVRNMLLSPPLFSGYFLSKAFADKLKRGYRVTIEKQHLFDHVKFLKDLLGEGFNLRRSRMNDRVWRTISRGNKTVLTSDVAKMIGEYGPGLVNGLPSSIDRKGFDIVLTAIHAMLPFKDIRYVATMEKFFGVKEFDKDDAKNEKNIFLEKLTETLMEKIRQKTNIRTNEIEFLKKVFKTFDQNGDGVIEIKEMQTVLLRFGIDLEPDMLKAFFKRYDTKNNGFVNYNEFARTLFPDQISRFAEEELETPREQW